MLGTPPVVVLLLNTVVSGQFPVFRGFDLKNEMGKKGILSSALTSCHFTLRLLSQAL
jgi:hypothetical protein